MKVVKSLKEAGLLIKGVNEAVENKVKEQTRWFLGAATLPTSLLVNMVADKIMKLKIPERETTIPGLEVIRAGEETTKQLEQVRIFNATSSFN